MKSSYRVRFASSGTYQKVIDSQGSRAKQNASASRSSFAPALSSSAPLHDPTCQASTSKPRRTKSRFGCKECRARRVKCDETFPVCLRCQRRGSLCLVSTRRVQWHPELSWLSNAIILDSWPTDGTLNKRLVQYWVEQTSQLLSLDRNNNPLSLPLLQHLTASPSLLHAIQSVSAGHETFFSNDNIDICLEERGRALRLVREELKDLSCISIPSILTVFVLGISSSWIEPRPGPWGKEHLDGARAMIKIALSNKKMRHDPLTKFILGWYLYWDMTCSFLDDAQSHSTPNLVDILSLLQQDGDSFHPMIGLCSELYADVAEVGRYYRRLLDHQTTRKPDFEQDMIKRLLAWVPDHHNQHLNDLSSAYRTHGLLMLYRACENPEELTWQVLNEGEGTEEPESEREAAIRSYALENIQAMSRLPMTEPCANFQSLPLLSAAAELTSEDAALRTEVINQFKALYSSSRVMVNMWSIELLEELWSLRDCGVAMSWMELSLVKGWQLCFS